MKVKLPVYASKAEIPKGFEELYEEVDGKWQQKADEEPEEKEKPEGDGAKKALKAERERAEKAEKKAKELADKLTELSAKLEEHDDEVEGKKHGKTGAEMKELREKIRADVRKEFTQQIDDLNAKIKELEPLGTENRTLRLNDRVKAEMLAAGARGERINELFLLSQEEFDLDEEKNPVLKNHPGKALKIFLEGDLKKRYPEFYKGTDASGGGAKGGNGTLKVGTTAEDVLANPAGAISSARAGS